jgi:hypothetical protein
MQHRLIGISGDAISPTTLQLRNCYMHSDIAAECDTVYNQRYFSDAQCNAPAQNIFRMKKAQRCCYRVFARDALLVIIYLPRLGMDWLPVCSVWTVITQAMDSSDVVHDAVRPPVIQWPQYCENEWDGRRFALYLWARRIPHDSGTKIQPRS